eukprot:TRINITY_DN38779_c0_g1_i1.p1 TRINITY_DN38779_c0_g1~~TRINITY_DN38779_c0_g1_i1.p1  ORF type:complete len:191 (+),score=69.26 TRINITY_DN38779_c0_g1_i1:380-952(+)
MQEELLRENIKNLKQQTADYRLAFQKKWRAGGRGQGPGSITATHWIAAWRKMMANMRQEVIENAVGATVEQADKEMGSQVRKMLVEVQAEDKFFDEAAPMLQLLRAVDEVEEENSYVRELAVSSGERPFKLDVLRGASDEEERLFDYYDVVYHYGVAIFACKVYDLVLEIFPEPPKLAEEDDALFKTIVT